jgi:PAS domain S-box-containing protein
MPRLAYWSDLRLRTKGLIAIAVPAAATVTIACVSYLVGAQADLAEHKVQASLRIREEVQKLKTFEIEASAQVRGYFITGDEDFAGKTRETLAGFDAARQRLSELTEDHPVQRQRVAQVEALERSRVEGIFGGMARFRSGALSREQLRGLLRSREAERLRMEGVLRAMENEEKRLLETRLNQAGRLRTILKAVTACCMFFGVVGGVLVSLLYGAGITQRIKNLQENVVRLATGGALNPMPGGRDEIGALGEGIARTAEVLRRRTDALENALHGIAEADASGRYLSCNRAYCEMTGLPEDATPAGILDTVLPADRDRVEEAIQAMRVSGRAETEAHIQRPDGSVSAVGMTFLPALEDRDAGYYVFLRDISLQERAEAALVSAKDAAVTSNLAKTEFLAKISHDIRNPLNAILGAADLLSESSLNSDQCEYVSMFQRNCRRLVSLINDFLDFSKIEAGAIKVEKVGYRIKETVDDAVATFQDSARRKGIELGVDWDSAVPEWALGDPLRIQQVLVNLLSNALKFTERGRVGVRVLLDRNGERIRFEVADTGPGIGDADQARIFAAFTQLPQQISTAIRGCGLGLTICRELVELMGGEIGVISQEGRGSTFHFSLPFETAVTAGANSEAAAAPASEVPDWRNRPVRVLVAEDTEDNRLLLGHYLRDEPVRIEFAADGQQAVDAIRRGKQFDLILMDIDLPVLDGYQSAKAIREFELGRGVSPTPIVALSAHAMREAVRASIEAGCIAHLAKPVDRPMLLKTLYRYALTTNARGAQAHAVSDEVAALVPKYLASKPAQIEEARASLARRDFEPIRRFGHNLKGTGSGYGFPRIEALGSEIEDAAERGDANRIADQLDALLTFVNESSSSAVLQ